MPITAQQMGGISGGLSAASGLAGGLISSFMQRNENQRQRIQEGMMYALNRKNMLQDWNMENMYNSPIMQMQRLKAAGLNPNLMYGQSASAGLASQPKTPTPNVSNNTTTKNPLEGFDAGGVINQMYDLKRQDAQTDLLRQQIQTQATTANLNSVSAALTAARTAREQQTTQQEKDSFDIRIKNLEATEAKLLQDIQQSQSTTRVQDAQVDNINANTQSTLDENYRKWQANELSLKQMAENIFNTQASTQERKANLGYTTVNTELTKSKILTEQNLQILQEIETYLTTVGLNKNDNVISRIIKNGILDIQNALSNPRANFKKTFEKMRQEIKSIKK